MGTLGGDEARKRDKGNAALRPHSPQLSTEENGSQGSSGKLFLKKGRTVAEAPAGVQYRVARLPVNWRGRLARKAVLRRFPAVARYWGTADGRRAGSGFQLQGGQCQPFIHKKARRQKIGRAHV